MAITVRVQAIVPKPFDVGKLRSELARALQEEGKRDRAEFNKTVEGWKGETPTMAWETKINASEAWVWIGPKGSESSIEKWRRIDEGVEEHEINSQTWMIFNWQGRGISYDAKTTPRKFSSSGPGKKIGPVIKTKHIGAHYITAREWSQTLADQRAGPFANDIQAAINRGLT